MLKACLNGRRSRADHPAVPLAAEALAADAAACHVGGASAVHVHPRDIAGRESLAAPDVDSAVAAIQARVPGLPVGVTTGAWIVPDAAQRARLIGDWTRLPDFASVNAHEDGWRLVTRTLLERGIGVEFGVWTVAAARQLLDTDLAATCVRILVEPTADDPAGALAGADAILDALAPLAGATPLLLHGQGRAAWPVLEHAVRRGLQRRIGLEDTVVLPDGTPVADNAALMSAAMAIR